MRMAFKQALERPTLDDGRGTQGTAGQLRRNRTCMFVPEDDDSALFDRYEVNQ